MTLRRLRESFVPSLAPSDPQPGAVQRPSTHPGSETTRAFGEPHGVARAATRTRTMRLRCLARGEWRPCADRTPLPSPQGKERGRACAAAVHRELRADCWHGDGDGTTRGSCDALLHSPLTGTFDGLFSNPERPIALAILGDSMSDSGLKVPSTLFGFSAPSARLVPPRAQAAPTQPGAQPEPLGCLPWLQELTSGLPKVAEFALSTTRSDQLARALALAKRVNGHLSSLQFARAEPSWRHAIQWGTETSSFLTTIPTTVAGCRRLLETSIRWPPHAQHRVILASSGAWYNVGEWCDILRAVPRYYGRQQRVQASPSGVCARALTPNHDDPIATPRPELLAGLGSGWVRGVGTYTVAQRFGGTATAAEYSRDVKAFAVAADEWLEAERRRGAGSSALLWMETGERVASFQPSNRCTERHSPCARSTTALPPARGHAAGASVWIAAVPTRPDKSPNTACSSKLARMLWADKLERGAADAAARRRCGQFRMLQASRQLA